MQNIKEILDETALDPGALPHDQVAAEIEESLAQINQELTGGTFEHLICYWAIVTENIEEPATEKKEEQHLDGMDFGLVVFLKFIEDGNDTFSDIEDDEIACYLTSEKDQYAKKVAWHLLNKGYYKEKAEKEERAKEAAAKPKKKRVHPVPSRKT